MAALAALRAALLALVGLLLAAGGDAEDGYGVAVGLRVANNAYVAGPRSSLHGARQGPVLEHHLERSF